METRGRKSRRVEGKQVAAVSPASGDAGDSKSGAQPPAPQPTALALRDGLASTVRTHGSQLNADRLPAARKTILLITERLPHSVMIELLSYLSLPHLARWSILNKLCQATYAKKPYAPWQKSLVLTKQDELTWFTGARAAGWIPDLKVVKRLVAEGHMEGKGPRLPLLRDPAIWPSVTDLTMDLSKTSNIPMSGWTALTRLRLVESRGQGYQNLPPINLLLGFLQPLAQRPPTSPPLQSLRLDFLARSHTPIQWHDMFERTPGLWSGLQILGLHVYGVTDGSWEELTRTCPQLVKLVVVDDATTSRVSNTTLGILGRAWLAMRYFDYHSAGPDVVQITPTGLVALTTWTQLQVLRFRWGHMDAADALPSEESAVMAKCVSAWPKLRRLTLPAVPIIVTQAVFDAVNKTCRRLQQLHFRVATIPADWKERLTGDLDDEERMHPDLQYTPAWTYTTERPRPLDALVLSQARYCPDIRFLAFNTDYLIRSSTLRQAILSLRQLRSIHVAVFRLEAAAFESFVDRALRPPQAPVDWTPRPRPLQQLRLVVTEPFIITDYALDCISSTCPDLTVFEVTTAANSVADALTRNTITVAKIVEVLDRCPKLTRFVLDVVPLAGVDALNPALKTLTMMLRDTACIVRFRLGRFRDASEESNKWFAKWTRPLAAGSTNTRTFEITLGPRYIAI